MSKEALDRFQALWDAYRELGGVKTDLALLRTDIEALIAERDTLSTYIARLEEDRDYSADRFRRLLGEIDQAKAKNTILQAQLGGWEAACAAQLQAARIYLDATADLAHNGPQIAARGRLVNAIESNVGELLLKRLAWAEAVSAALQSAASAVIEAWVAVEESTPLDLDLSALAVTLGDIKRGQSE